MNDHPANVIAMSAPLTGFWIKSHSAILENVTLATLPDNLWRRYQELKHLLAHDATSGELPTVNEIAFRLRVLESQLSEELNELEGRGLIIQEGINFILPNFCEEQAADSDAIRKRRQREKEQRSRNSHDAVTNRDTERVEQKDESRADEPPMAVLAAASDMVVSNCTEADEPDDAFWERQKLQRPDLNINREIEAMNRYLHKKGDTRGITRRFAKSWIKGASREVKPPRRAKQKKVEAIPVMTPEEDERNRIEGHKYFKEIQRQLKEEK